MIPEPVREVARGPVWLVVGSRDARLRPTVDYAFGVRIEDERHVTVVVPEVRARALRDRLQACDRIAVVLDSKEVVRCFQLKGKVVDARQGGAEEDGLCDIHAARLATVIPNANLVLGAMRRRPHLAFTVRVDSVFDQTPGPGAGRRLDGGGEPPRPAAIASAPQPHALAVIPAELKGALGEVTPCSIATCSQGGEPNATVISEVQPVDANHVALSFQFFNKTVKNVRENPFASVKIFDMRHLINWNLDLQYLRSESTGPVFEEMAARLEVIASMTGMTGVFKLRAAEIYGVLEVRRNEDEFA